MKANLKKWHQEVCERDNYTCYKCHKYFGYDCYFDENGRNLYVCGDHIKTQGSRPDLRHDIDNGRCVCKSCHNDRHSGR